MSTKTLRRTNVLTEAMSDILTYFNDPANLGEIQILSIDWKKRAVSSLPPSLKSFLAVNNFIKEFDGQSILTDTGLSLMGKLLIDLRSIQESEHLIGDKYKIESVITTGKNSATFKVRHQALNREFVLKVI